MKSANFLLNLHQEVKQAHGCFNYPYEKYFYSIKIIKNDKDWY